MTEEGASITEDKKAFGNTQPQQGQSGNQKKDETGKTEMFETFEED